MTPEELLLRLGSALPAAVGAWALASLGIAALRIRSPRLRAAIWTWVVADAALALGGCSTAALVTLRCVVPEEVLRDRIAPLAPTLLAVWAVVAAVLAGRRIAGALRVAAAARVLHATYPAPEAVRTAAAGARAAFPPGDGSPFVAGFLRPVIVVPRDFWTRLASDERAAAVAHETAHAAGRHGLHRFAAGLAADVLWFALPLRAALRRLDDACEGAADEAALRTGASRPALARAVVAATLGGGAPAGAAALGGDASRLVRRLEAMRRPVARRTVWLQAAAFVVFAPWSPGADCASIRPAAPDADGRGRISVGLSCSANPVQRAALFLAHPRGAPAAIGR